MKSIILFHFGIFMLISSTTFSQGEDLFKQKCNTCHLVDRSATGPWLKGVKQKWADAGEAELLYKWVANPPALIASRQSKMASAIKGFNASDMPPQMVTNEEIDAILDYVDNYVTPIPETPVENGSLASGGSADYENNLILFYWLFGLMVFLIIVIIIMTNTIIHFIRSDFFEQKRNKQQPLTTNPGILLAAIFFVLIPHSNQGYALSYLAPDTTEKTPWLLIEKFDLYLLLAADIALVFVVLYLKGVFTSLVSGDRS